MLPAKAPSIAAPAKTVVPAAIAPNVVAHAAFANKPILNTQLYISKRVPPAKPGELFFLPYLNIPIKPQSFVPAFHW
jgi:hypothetical protein